METSVSLSVLIILTLDGFGDDCDVISGDISGNYVYGGYAVSS